MNNEKRFYIDCYGICDTWRKGNTCNEVKMSWSEICDTLNQLYENVDTDKQLLLIEIDKLKEENKRLRECLTEIHTISSREDTI